MSVLLTYIFLGLWFVSSSNMNPHVNTFSDIGKDYIYNVLTWISPYSHHHPFIATFYILFVFVSLMGMARDNQISMKNVKYPGILGDMRVNFNVASIIIRGLFVVWVYGVPYTFQDYMAFPGKLLFIGSIMLYYLEIVPFVVFIILGTIISTSTSTYKQPKATRAVKLKISTP